MAKRVYALSRAIVTEYINRKTANLLSLLVNTQSGDVFAVPHNKEHAQLAAELLGVSVDELSLYKDSAAKFVPVNILFNPEHDEVTGILTGVSGIEMGYRVRHTATQLEVAHHIVHALVKEGDFAMAEPLETDEIIRKFQAKV